MELEKLPPHDIEAEKAVVGSLLIDGDSIVRVAPVLRAEDFFGEDNSWVYAACLDLFERGEAINPITVAHQLSLSGRLEAAGGAAYLSQLVYSVPTSVHAEYYAQIVQRTALMRRLISASGQIAAIGYAGEADVDAALSRAEDILFRLRYGRERRDFVALPQLLDGFLREEAETGEEGERSVLARIPTGFIDLDKLLGGLHRSDLIIVAARPGLGKSSLALNIARNAALQGRARVAIFSLEMPKEQLLHRLLAAEAGVDALRVRLNQHTEAEWTSIMGAIATLSELAIWVDDSPSLRPVEMRGKARRLHDEVGLDLVVVDYLGLMHGNVRYDNRVQEISEISRSLKSLARELNVPVLALSQLSRAPEARTPHRPMLSDLRDSGSIEQDADVVMFIYPEYVYYTPEDWERQFPNKPYPKGVCELIVAKHRHGPVGVFQMLFQEAYTRFRSLSKAAS